MASNDTSGSGAPIEEELPAGYSEWGPLFGIVVPLLLFSLVLYLGHRRNPLTATYNSLTRPALLWSFWWFMPVLVLTFVLDGVGSYMVYAYGVGTQSGTAALVMYAFFVIFRLLWTYFWFERLNFWRAFYAQVGAALFGFIALILFFVVYKIAGGLFLLTYLAELYIAFATYLVALNNATDFPHSIRLPASDPRVQGAAGDAL